MEYRKLGDSDLEVSAITMGCAGFSAAGPLSEGGGEWIDDIVNRALDAGITLFDTAQTYGHGASEERLGRALKGKRDRALIATKFRDFEQWDVDDIIARLDKSLKRLGTDHVDLYQTHWPLKEMTEKAAAAMTEMFEKCISSGRARAAGVSNFRMEHLRLMPPEGLKLLASNQIPISLLNRSYLDGGEVEFCRRNGISILVYSPLEAGMLGGRYTRDEKPPEGSRASTSGWAREDRYEKAMLVMDAVSSVAGEIGCAPSQVAMKWVLDIPGVAATITGATSPGHLNANVNALDIHLSDEAWRKLDEASIAARSE